MFRKITATVITVLLVCSISHTAVFASTTILVSKDKTADGSVLFAHNEDLGYTPQHLVSVPRREHASGAEWIGISDGTVLTQPTTTYAYIASTIFDKMFIPGDYTTGVNEYRVTIAGNIAFTKDVTEGTEWELRENGLIWTEYIQLVLERAKSAKEGIELIGRLHEEHDLSGAPGAVFGIADPNECWVIELAVGGQWIAKRVPNNAFYAIADSYTIGSETNLNSSETLHSPNLISYATEQGWYNRDKDGAFSFKDMYGNSQNQLSVFNSYRIDVANSMLAAAPITKERLMAILRSNFEGTDYYETDANGSPLGSQFKTINSLDTDISAVVQLRSDLPAEIGATIWLALAAPKTSPYIPWYPGAKQFPQPYQSGDIDSYDDSAYWSYRGITAAVHENYPKAYDTVKNIWDEFETAVFAGQAAIEAEAANLLSSSGAAAASSFLNDYSSNLAESAYDQAIKLTDTLSALTARFQDIQNHWAKDYINAVAEMGLFNGTSETTFSPNQTMTRGMFITVIGRMAGVNGEDFEAAAASLPFTDVKAGAYYAPFIAWALDEGIVSGLSEEIFAPDKDISRQEMCVMLYNLIKAAGLEANPDLQAVVFNDANMISSWAAQSVNILSAVGLIEGYEGNFNPLGLSTRAEAATLLARFMYTVNL